MTIISFFRGCGAKRSSRECSEVLDSLQKILDEAGADPKIGTATFYEKVRNKNRRTLL